MFYYLIFINIFVFLLYGIDKRKAIKKKRRISEFELLFCSFLGGSIGSILGMIVCHHKTLKWYFWFINIIVLLITIWIIIG